VGFIGISIFIKGSTEERKRAVNIFSLHDKGGEDPDSLYKNFLTPTKKHYFLLPKKKKGKKRGGGGGGGSKRTGRKRVKVGRLQRRLSCLKKKKEKRPLFRRESTTQREPFGTLKE